MGVDPNNPFGGFPPDLVAAMEQARARQQMAQALQQRFLQPIQPTNSGPIMSRTPTLAPLLQALGSYITQRTSNEAMQDVGKAGQAYQDRIQQERTAVADKPVQEQISTLLASMNPMNREYATALQGNRKAEQEITQSQAQVKHLENQDVQEALRTNIQRGQLDEQTRHNMVDEDYHTKYMAHLNDQLVEAVRHNKQDEAAKLLEIKNQAIQARAAATSAGAAASNAATNARNAALHEQELGVHRYMAGLDPNTGQPDTSYDTIAKGIAEYKSPPPTGMGANSQRALRIMDRVRELNPQYDATEYDAKKKAQTFFTSGSGATQLRAFATATQHLEQLQGLADALANGNTQLFNKLRNEYQTQTGKPAPTNFQSLLNVVGPEIVTATVAEGGGMHEREEAMKPFNVNNSPAQISGALRQTLAAMKAKRDNLMEQAKSAGVSTDKLIPQYQHGSLPPAADELEAARAEARRRGLLK